MWWTNAPAFALPWLATVAVAVLLAIASGAVWRRPAAATSGRGLRLAGTVVVGLLALAATVWQALAITDGQVAARQVAARQVAARQVAAAAVASRNRGRPPTPNLQKQIKSLEVRVAQLEHSTTMRMIGPDTAKKLADYLKGFGSRSVVVSAAPNDVEAYDYATQLTNVFRSAGWNARGPEVTTIFGDVRAMGVNVYDIGASGGDTVNILLGGLAKFNVPFQVRVAPPQVPEDAAADLFVGAQPVQRAVAAADQPAP